MSTGVHHVEVFRDDRTGLYGVHCFTCADITPNLADLAAAESLRDDHEGACSCASH